MFNEYHSTKEGQKELDQFKEGMIDAARIALSIMQEGRNKELFKCRMEEAYFFGKKAIIEKAGNFMAIKNN